MASGDCYFIRPLTLSRPRSGQGHLTWIDSRHATADGHQIITASGQGGCCHLTALAPQIESDISGLSGRMHLVLQTEWWTFQCHPAFRYSTDLHKPNNRIVDAFSLSIGTMRSAYFIGHSTQQTAKKQKTCGRVNRRVRDIPAVERGTVSSVDF